MKVEFEVLGLSRKHGIGDDGKPYDYYKVHIAYPNEWVEGLAVACVNIQSVLILDRQIMVGSRCEGIIVTAQGRTRVYLV